MRGRLNVSAWAIADPLPAAVFFTALALLGVLSFFTLPVTRVPNIDTPVVAVVARQPGAAPAELESQVSKPIEDALASVPGVRHISSAVVDGVSTTLVEFRIEVATDRAVTDVRDAVTLVRPTLPRDLEEPVVRRIDVEGAPILTFAVENPDRSVEQISWFIDDVVKRRLGTLKGISRVERVGGLDREIRLSLDPDRMNAIGLTVADVSQQLRMTNADAAGGRSEIGDGEQVIRTLSNAESVDELGDSMVALSFGRKVRLGALGTLTDGAGEPRRFARLDGTPVVGLQVYRAKGASDIAVAEAVDATLTEISGRERGYRFRLIETTVAYTDGNYRSAMETLVEGALCTVIVVLLFLRDWRATAIAAVALPLSILPTFWAMTALGFSLNLVSLLAVTMATGVLVDDSIVEIENIDRHIRMGKPPWQAAIDASDEIGLAVMAITLTVVAIFAPVSFMGGLAGQYFKQFGLTVAVAVLFSLLVARLITPVLAARMLRWHRPTASSVSAHSEGRMLALYTSFVRISVRHRWLTVAAGCLVFAGSLYCIRFLPTGFIPPGDDARLLYAVELPPGARLADTAAVTDTMAAVAKRHREVSSVFADGGALIGGETDVRKATLIVRLVHKSQRGPSQSDLRRILSAEFSRIPDIRCWPVQGTGLRELALVLAGAEDEKAARLAHAVVAGMKRLPLVVAPVSTLPFDRPEVQIRPRGDLAADLGISTEAIARTVRIATIGDSDVNLAKFRADARLVPIRVALDEGVRGDIAALGSLRVPTALGGSVPLNAVADVSFGYGPASIVRYDRNRRYAIEADLADGVPIGQALAAVSALAEVAALPPGVSLLPTGDAELQAEVFAGFAWAIGAGVLIVYIVLILLFRSLLQPVVILFSLPLSLGGVIGALWLTAQPVSLPVVLGILMLIGIVTKNAIMLVDFANRGMAEGLGCTEALVEAGRNRARPIVMTTLAMAAGMAPSTLALGDGGEFRAPMAIALIGGLAASTALSLLFVPAAFKAVEGLARVRRRVADAPTDDDRVVPVDFAAKPPLAGEPHPVGRPALRGLLGTRRS